MRRIVLYANGTNRAPRIFYRLDVVPVPITITIIAKLQHFVLVKRETGVRTDVANGSRYLIKNIGDARGPVDVPIRGLMKLLVKNVHLHIVLGSIGSAAIGDVIPNSTRDG